jgi:hypothetical protein
MTVPTQLKALLISLPLCLVAASPVFAQGGRQSDEDSGSDTLLANGEVILTPDAVIQRLEQRGHYGVRQLVYANGAYSASVTGKDGRVVILKIDAASGEVRGDERGNGEGSTVLRRTRPLPIDQPARSNDGDPFVFSQIKAGLEGGYTDVENVGQVDNHFRVQARNDRGQRVRLLVDATTGEIVRERIVVSFGQRWPLEDLI